MFCLLVRIMFYKYVEIVPYHLLSIIRTTMMTLISTLNMELLTKNDCGVRSALVLKPADSEVGSRDKYK